MAHGTALKVVPQTEAATPSVEPEDVDTSTALLMKLGRCRTQTLMIGAFGLTAATADTEEARDRALREMTGCVQTFSSTLAGLSGDLDALGPGIEGPRERIRAYAADVTALDTAQAPSPADAQTLVWRAWDDAGPALQALIECIIGAAAARQAADRAEVEARARTVLAMCDEMAGIGRTIHLISLNAAVEAARAGGESGRVFGTIAQEVRTLAGRAAKVVERTRARLTPPE